MSLGKLLKDTMHLETSDLLVTPKLTKFLMDNPEGLLMTKNGLAVAPATKKLMGEIMDKTFAGNSDRSGRFGASGRGTCLRKQVFTYLGMPNRKVQDVDLTNLFNDGKWRHLRWQVMMKQSGAVTEVEVPYENPSYRMTTSIDAVNDDEGFLVELKGDRHPSRMMGKKGGVDEKHDLQIHSMFLVTGFTVASYIVEDKQSQVWREVIVEEDPRTMQIVIDELEELNVAVDNRAMPPMLPACTMKQGPYASCPFADACLARQKNPYFPENNQDWNS